MKNKAAIIIVNWNGKNLLKDCISSIYSQSYKNFDLYFIDNGSRDGSVNFVKQNFPKTKIIELDHNTGFAKGNNVGIKEAFQDKEIEYIVCLNNDTIVDRKWLHELIKTVEKDDEIGLASSKIILPNKKLHTVGLALEKNIQGYKEGGACIGYNNNPNDYCIEMEIFSPVGTSMILKRELLEEIGLFDEDFFAYCEDFDLGFRARLAGWKCYYSPESKVIHLHSQTSNNLSLFKAYYSKRNCYFAAIKNFNLFYLLTYPFRDFWWNIKNLNNDRIKANQSPKKKNQFSKLIIVVAKAYLSVMFNLPKMAIKRINNNKIKKINKKEYKKLFKIFSRENCELSINGADNFIKLQKNFYKNIASKFDEEQRRDNRNHLNKIKAINNFLEIKNADKVLEIGIGTGIHAKYILDFNKNKKIYFYGVDISEDMLRVAKKKLGDRVSMMCMAGEDLKFPDNFFDKIYISGSLHHFKNPELGIREIIRVLKKDGKFCILEPNILFPINFYAANKFPEEKNIKLMRKSNFKKWLNKGNIKYNIINFAYTPPFPKLFIPIYNIFDKIIFKIPFLKNFSIMLFIIGTKK